MVFKDRIEAAHLLADKLETYKEKNAIILAIPRGAVPMGYVISKQLHLPLEVVLSKKIGHPLHKEFAIGAVTQKSQVLSEAASDVSKSYIEEEIKKIRTLLSKRYQDYYGNKKPQELKDKILIIVDDGIATGNTIISTIEMLHEEQPKKIVVAIPVSSQSALQKLKNTPFIDEIVCLSAPENFRAVGQFYKNFDQVDDTEVKTYLNKVAVN
ncbi:phosphoribosyltransferase [Thalassobellus suaedae]|uniref:Phosphoribosyltransferase family protein n=1 Tax=Thalassobellus suaedae TaxID=3074124 RepID=A0ABY9XPD1_9FLAO|nr:phosphoribosyltransferase family protein [Flavobacteriaceae bacterium HL-DH14]WNH13111.1 phosphoribosyltransferase family protein [Flavobacteriaceae bacterium HL-DH10]